jgi:hypothetical protein
LEAQGLARAGALGLGRASVRGFARMKIQEPEEARTLQRGKVRARWRVEGSCPDQVLQVGELGFADAGHLAEFVHGVEAAVLGAVVEDALCQDGAYAR